MIHETAVIHPSAKLGNNVSVGPYSVIGSNVEIGDNTWIGPHVVVSGPTKIGRDNRIYQFASIGEDPQDLKYKGEPTILEIGDGNQIREFVTISRGTVQGGNLTFVGDNNLLMAYVHIAHDCIVGSNCIFSNNASLAGHVTVYDFANVGGMVGVHQFCKIGSYSFCAGGSIIVKDVPPFVMVSGHPARVFGLNTVGMKRRGLTDDTVLRLKRAYKTLYRQGLTVDEAITAMNPDINHSVEVKRFADFVLESARGITR